VYNALEGNVSQLRWYPWIAMVLCPFLLPSYAKELRVLVMVKGVGEDLTSESSALSNISTD
jgi:hypothetical protein